MTTQTLCQQCGHDQSAHRDGTCRYCVRRQAAQPKLTSAMHAFRKFAGPNRTTVMRCVACLELEGAPEPCPGYKP